MLIETTHVNATEGFHLSDAERINVSDTIFDADSPTLRGDIFRWSRREYGRCIGHAYVGDGIPIGWVFVKREKYDDTNETYLHETWVTLLEKHETHVEREYATV